MKNVHHKARVKGVESALVKIHTLYTINIRMYTQKSVAENLILIGRIDAVMFRFGREQKQNTKVAHHIHKCKIPQVK